MRLRLLAAFPLLYALLFAVVAWQLQGGEAFSPFVIGQRLLVRSLALAGCLVAAAAFRSGDPLRRAWWWLAAASALSLVRDLLGVASLLPSAAPGEIEWLGFSLLVGSNLALVAGVFQLTHCWKAAALEPMSGRAWLVTLLLVGAALAVAGPAVVESGRRLLAGDTGALTGFVSGAADILALCLLGPLLLAALELRGGLFSWPWALVTASLFSWLLYDATAPLASSLTPGFPEHEVFRGLAQNFRFAAGLAQAWVIREVRRGAA